MAAQNAGILTLLLCIIPDFLNKRFFNDSFFLLISLSRTVQDFHNEDTYGVYYSYELYDQQDALVGSGSVLFCPPKHFHFVDPELTVRVEDDEITVSAKAYARAVEIQAGPDTVLSDNFFDMNAGEKTVKVLRGAVCGQVTARSVFDIR